MKSSKRWLVFDIGCLECGEDSTALKIFKTKKEAKEFANSYTNNNTTWGREEWSGQHSIQVFEIEMD